MSGGARSRSRRISGAPRLRALALGALLCVGLLGSLLAGASPASAQTSWDTPGEDGFDWSASSGGSVELGFWTAGVSGALGSESRTTTVSGLLRVGIVVEEVLELGIIAGWAWGDLQIDAGLFRLDEEAASATNPMLRAAYLIDDARYRIRVGGGVALPAAPADGNARTALFYGGGATRGLGELYLFAPNRLSVVAEATVEAVPIEHLYVEGALRVGVMFPVEDTPALLGDSNGEVDVPIEIGAGVGAVFTNFLGGVRLRGVFVPTVENAASSADQAQTSLELFARALGRLPSNGISLYGEARLSMNLDDELGFAFDEGKVWGLFFAFGAGVAP